MKTDTSNCHGSQWLEHVAHPAIDECREIDVDGNILTSDTNTFEDGVQGLDITVLRVPTRIVISNLKSNKVGMLTTDKGAIKGAGSGVC